MKEKSLIISLMVLSMIGILGTMALMGYHESQAVEAVNNEWRQAAVPVFEARNIPNLASHATPHDLARALDANSAMTHYEAVKISPYGERPNARTKILIVPAYQNWVRAD